jgi:hypothetical protein
MATFIAQLQKNFKLTVEDGLPQAPVEVTGVTHWIKCCPLCGSVHQIQTLTEGMVYTPICQTHTALYKAELTAWHKLYPDVAQYKSLHLVKKAA